MTTTKVKNGQIVTSTSVEMELYPDDPQEFGDTLLMRFEIVSGTLYFGVGPAGGSPVINGSTQYGSYTDGETYRTIQPGKFNARVLGSGTFRVCW